MACFALDSIALYASAKIQDTNDPWYQFQNEKDLELGSFVTTSLSIINAYAFAARGKYARQTYSALTDILVPFWDSSQNAYEILTLDDKHNAIKLGEFSSPYIDKHPLEDIFIAYVCQEYYPGTMVCGYDSPLYKKLKLPRGYLFD